MECHQTRRNLERIIIIKFIITTRRINEFQLMNELMSKFVIINHRSLNVTRPNHHHNRSSGRRNVHKCRKQCCSLQSSLTTVTTVTSLQFPIVVTHHWAQAGLANNWVEIRRRHVTVTHSYTHIIINIECLFGKNIMSPGNHLEAERFA